MTVEELMQKGLASLRDHSHLHALSLFERAYQIRKDPVIQSYLALCIALERGKVSDAVALCGDSMLSDPDNPVHYLNLGKVYLKARRKNDALDMLRKGLSRGNDADIHEEIRAVLDSLGTRKTPVFSFLPRSHYLNKHIGILLGKLRLR